MIHSDLSGRVALVTGASSGIGHHFAQTLARAGARVAIGARRSEKLESLASEIAAAGGRALPLRLDVTDRNSVVEAFAHAETELGTPDIIVNNAGVTIDRPSLEQDEEEWDRVVDTDLKGAWLVACEGARRLVAAEKGGSIINVASILGILGTPRVAAYTAAKAGLINLSRSLAIEWARHDIRVNALCPGYIITDLNREFLEGPVGEKLARRIPQRRFGQASDLDGPLLLLASDASRWMTGSALVVDGGQSAAA
ncbi:SDR family NAD(P)-dependent oxidoreductase [Aquibaculum arenosum]|uniref:Glucose 1-dehydrogenase n=1 Tax=Aquibaculum arenosum TaxID=3032591 RepID=A0ABT5YI70_9PROT|nr:glucose 1-dehydrogenase [Fodinicurvata sp. CAU 1616]MDF2094636.1 glucose 1-dehydrogenase [Fodinicurvata sp. CAU 1616]